MPGHEPSGFVQVVGHFTFGVAVATGVGVEVGEGPPSQSRSASDCGIAEAAESSRSPYWCQARVKAPHSAPPNKRVLAVGAFAADKYRQERRRHNCCSGYQSSHSAREHLLSARYLSTGRPRCRGPRWRHHLDRPSRCHDRRSRSFGRREKSPSLYRTVPERRGAPAPERLPAPQWCAPETDRRRPDRDRSSKRTDQSPRERYP